MKVLHGERIPSQGPVVLSGNHLSNMDPIFLALVRWRPVYYMAKVELFSINALFSTLLRGVHAFPIRRGEADRSAIATAGRLLAEERIVGVFPEGTRSGGELGEGLGGAALVALRAGCPVVPVGIHGTQDIMPEGARMPRLPRVTIAVGDPIDPSDHVVGSRREQVESMTGAIMQSIETMYIEAEGRARR